MVAQKPTSAVVSETDDARANVLSCPIERREGKPSTQEIQIRTALSIEPKYFRGRVAWTLLRLIEAGERGLSAAEVPAGLRLAAYVLKLRRAGIGIETEHEHHSGEYGGVHGRYRLTEHVEVVGGS